MALQAPGLLPSQLRACWFVCHPCRGPGSSGGLNFSLCAEEQSRRVADFPPRDVGRVVWPTDAGREGGGLRGVTGRPLSSSISFPCHPTLGWTCPSSVEISRGKLGSVQAFSPQQQVWQGNRQLSSCPATPHQDTLLATLGLLQQGPRPQHGSPGSSPPPCPPPRAPVPLPSGAAPFLSLPGGTDGTLPSLLAAGRGTRGLFC